MKYKKVPNNENAIEVDEKVILSFDPRYKEYLKWRDENPDLEEQLLNDLELEIKNKRLYNLGAPRKKDNVWKWYYEDGTLKLVAEMKDGEYNGEVKEYYQNGNIKSKEIFVGSKQLEYYCYYNESGQKLTEASLKNGKYDGEKKSYSSDRNLIYIETFKNGKKHGKTEYFHDKSLSGRNNRVETWKNGKLHGEYIDYHLNNKERAKGNMLYGIMEGKWIFWYHNGVKELECEFDFGNPVGNVKVYHDNGILKKEIIL